MAILTLLYVFGASLNTKKEQLKFEDFNTDTKAVARFSLIEENVQKQV